MGREQAPLGFRPSNLKGEMPGGINMLTYNTLLASEAIKLIDMEIERIKENLTTAHHTESFNFNTYNKWVGKVEGLRAAIQLISEAESLVNGRT